MEEKEEKRCWHGVRTETDTGWFWDLWTGAKGSVGEEAHPFPMLSAPQGNLPDSCPAAATSERGEDSEGQHRPG